MKQHRISLTQRAFLRQWLTDPRAAVRYLIDEIRASEVEAPLIRAWDTGETLFNEGEPNDKLMLLVSGRIALVKADAEGRTLLVNRLRPGALFGVLSFFSGNPTLTTALAESPAEVLELTRDQVDALTHTSAGTIAPLVRQMITANLLDRYRQVVDLNLKLEAANDAIRRAQARLVHQEKMATLGQLVAGVAHEINNPAGALQSGLRHLFEKLGEHMPAATAHYFSAGWERGAGTGEASPAERTAVRLAYPDLSQADQRLLLGMPPALRTEFDRQRDPALRRAALDAYDIGSLLRTTRISGDRIAGLVRSLKSYSRQDNGEAIETDLLEGLRESLQVLSNRLRRIEVMWEAEPVPPVRVNPAEFNQVWTNLIVNACDAMSDQGRLLLRVYRYRDLVVAEVHDSGHGIAQEHLARIFEVHFTTRNASGHFGLGLGLAISRDIVRKQGGEIRAGRSDMLGGACFTVELPIGQEKANPGQPV